MAYLNYKTVCDFIESNEEYTHDQINVKSHKREFVTVRQLCMYFCLNKTNTSLALIGNYYGRDHATVIHARKTINNLYDTDSSIRKKIDEYNTHFIKVKDDNYILIPILPAIVDLKGIRLAVGVTQYKASKGIPMDRSFISRIESGEEGSKLPYNTVKKMLDYYRKIALNINYKR